ncbi:hypothetical protein D3C79_1013060 [compost metagenome]
MIAWLLGFARSSACLIRGPSSIDNSRFQVRVQLSSRGCQGGDRSCLQAQKKNHQTDQ